MSYRIPIVVAALSVFLLSAGIASARERCCFRVKAKVSGGLFTEYTPQTASSGFAVTGQSDGTWDMEWEWTIREIAEYSETDNFRRIPSLSQLSLGEGSKRNSPTKLRFLYRVTDRLCEMERPRDTNGDGLPDTQNCDPPFQVAQGTCDPNYRLTSKGQYARWPFPQEGSVDFRLLSSSRPVLETRAGTTFPGLGFGAVRGISESGRRCRTEGASNHDPFVPQIDHANYVFPQPVGRARYGPFRYQVMMPSPSRADFRTGTRFTTQTRTLTQNHRLIALFGGTPHTMNATSQIQISFTHFPESELKKQLRWLRGL